MWPIGQQIGKIATNLSCPIGLGQLDCLRSKTGLELQQALLATGAQFQPVTDNITIWKEYVFVSILSLFDSPFPSYVLQTRKGHTAKVPLLIGTNKVSLASAFHLPLTTE